MVSNALAAAAVGHLAGISPDRIRAGLEAFVPEKGRMIIVNLKRAVRLIDDTYNANPGSMKAAIDTLMRLKKKQGRAICVLGDMLELGDHSESFHHLIGAYVKNAGAFRLCVTGRFADSVAAGAIEAGMDKESVLTGTKESILEDLYAILRSGDWVLVKGSRGMAMETVVQALKAWAEKNGK
jgi:UDP-N-acetylmuramyl pentapeptide synthase